MLRSIDGLIIIYLVSAVGFATSYIASELGGRLLLQSQIVAASHEALDEPWNSPCYAYGAVILSNQCPPSRP